MNDQSNPTQTTVGAWDADLYDSKHAFVSEYGLELVEMLAPQPGERILDLGCGTGRLAAEISKAGAQAVGVDIDPSMIERARAAYPDVEFVVADAARFTCGEPFDAVFSNAAIHWVKDTHGVMATLGEVLKPGGTPGGRVGRQREHRGHHQSGGPGPGIGGIPALDRGCPGTSPAWPTLPPGWRREA